MGYLIESEQFGLSEIGFHFLRSRFNYKTLYYSEIDRVELKRGHSIKNWVVILIFGIIAFSVSIIWTIGILMFFQNGKGVIYVEELVSPLILFLFGIFCLYKSFQKTDTIHIYFDKKHDFFNLESIDVKNEIIKLMEDKIGKNKVVFQ
ncbi:hypothetical protein [Emticicia oligotrophica]|uniref:hypothetical protein n=1 Tax=Emticicia oligotrophica TaxID=312279 RepID=UPI00273C8776|nr:hypothetical protein [Emticicia oligotrophica]